jgi:hypothetical protein
LLLLLLLLLSQLLRLLCPPSVWYLWWDIKTLSFLSQSPPVLFSDPSFTFLLGSPFTTIALESPPTVCFPPSSGHNVLSNTAHNWEQFSFDGQNTSICWPLDKPSLTRKDSTFSSSVIFLFDVCDKVVCVRQYQECTRFTAFSTNITIFTHVSCVGSSCSTGRIN